MNKLLTKIVGLSLGLSMAIGVGVAASYSEKDAVRADAASATTEFTLSSADPVSKDGVSVSFAKGSGSNAPAWYSAGLRLYAKNTLTISFSSNITGVSFDWEKQGSKAFATVSASTGNYTHPTKTGTGTWTGSASSVVFTLGTSGQLQLNTFSVTHESVTVKYVTGVDINETTSSLNITNSTPLTTTITPSDATDKSVSWTSSDADVLRVSSSGIVTAVGEGTAIIKAHANGSDPEGSDVEDTLSISSVVDTTYDYCDVINPTMIGVTSSSYTEWSDKSAQNTSASNAVYHGKTGYSAANDIQMNDTAGNGIITSSSGGMAKKVAIVWNENATTDRSLDVYGSSSEISLSDMGEKIGQITCGSTTELSLGAGYRYIGLDSNKNALYITAIIIYWDDSTAPALDLSGETAANVGDSVVYTATRYNSSATIDWYVDSVKQTSEIVVSGDTSTFTYSASEAGSFEIKAQLNGTEVYRTKELTVTSIEKYTLVTDITQLTVGNKVLLAANYNDVTYVAKSYESGNNVKSVETTITNNQITKTTDMASLTLGAASDGWTLKDENNYYWYAASTTNNYLKGKSSLEANSYWSISYSSGVFTIQATNNSERGTIMFNGSGTSRLFSCYASTQTYPSVSLYVLNTTPSTEDKLTTYGALFLHSVEIPLVTQETGIEGSDCIDLGYYAKAKAALATSSGAWSSIRSDLQLDTTGLALRYEAWARASGDANPYDGNEEISSNSRLISSLFGTDSSTSIVIIVTITAISLTSVGAFFALRKRKENI